MIELPSGTHTFISSTLPRAKSVLYLGVAACDDGVSSDNRVVDPQDAEPDDVVGYSFCFPAVSAGGHVYEDTISDSTRIIIDGVECIVCEHDYEDDGTAVAVIRRVDDDD